MQIKTQNQAINQRTYKISILFLVLILALSAFLYKVYSTINSDRRLPSHTVTIQDRSFRGSIISADDYTLSSSEKTYLAVVRGASVKPEKKALFSKLFSIYSGIDEKEILSKFLSSSGEPIQGNIILSKYITTRSAMQLKALAYKLRKLEVFRAIKTSAGVELMYGLDIVENKERRFFPLEDILTPIIGYVGDEDDGKYIRTKGRKGLERAYEKYLKPQKDGFIQGKRDVLQTIIHDKNTISRARVDGFDLHLNIPLSLQRRMELMGETMKNKIDADEILIGVMESHTGKVLSLATTNRYNPTHITAESIPALVPKFSEYPYEAGSVIKPLTLAIALDNNVVNPNTRFNTDYARFHISKRRTISDDERFPFLSATDIIVHSSNIGISQISWKVKGKVFREGLLKFGIAKKTGIDLSRDLPGGLKSRKLLKNKMHRANTAYGYGMMVTFAQLLKAYSAFNNEGLAMSPRLVDYLSDSKGNHYTLSPKTPDIQAVSPKTANQMKTILQEVVKRGTGVKAQYEGLEVGGKTGTAHIAKNGHYVREFHSSFYGFVNDKKGHNYTIGVLVIRAKARYKYFAAESAVPTFRRAVDILVELDYLEPEANLTIVTPPPTPPQNCNVPYKAPFVPRKETVRKIQKVQKRVPIVKPPVAPKTPPPILTKPKKADVIDYDLY